MEAAGSYKTIVFIYQTTRRHVSDDSNVNLHRRENLKFHKYECNL
jgi:hypothetical protein